ncbi:hypothetical protein H0H81_005180 [Sphagnurus paluster]|uniref:Uncharacterized protein n=1 Tax=Sphagnurus paluster TaxID=117069 RepID=A0A9P7GM87_9AGAR|nr:hypothetical protein H0H81_005180 [Sphagnurus paluster]
MHLSSLFIIPLLYCTSINAATSISDILNDIAGISSALNTFNNNVGAFPTTGGTLAKAYVRSILIAPMISTHHNAGHPYECLGSRHLSQQGHYGRQRPLSYSNGLAVLKASQALKPVVAQSLSQTVAIQGALQALPGVNVQAYIAQDLATLSTGVSNFGAAMVGIAPFLLVAEATFFKIHIDLLLSNASGALKSSPGLK